MRAALVTVVAACKHTSKRNNIGGNSILQRCINADGGRWRAASRKRGRRARRGEHRDGRDSRLDRRAERRAHRNGPSARQCRLWERRWSAARAACSRCRALSSWMLWNEARMRRTSSGIKDCVRGKWANGSTSAFVLQSPGSMTASRPMGRKPATGLPLGDVGEWHLKKRGGPRGDGEGGRRADGAAHLEGLFVLAAAARAPWRERALRRAGYLRRHGSVRVRVCFGAGVFFLIDCLSTDRAAPPVVGPAGGRSGRRGGCPGSRAGVATRAATLARSRAAQSSVRLTPLVARNCARLHSGSLV